MKQKKGSGKDAFPKVQGFDSWKEERMLEIRKLLRIKNSSLEWIILSQELKQLESGFLQ